MTGSLQEISPNAEIVSKQQALRVNTNAAVGLMNVLKSNLGPTGTLKLLVGGAGQLKLTKDGLTLLKEMQIQHPTAAMIARSATAQDDITGDGTTSTVLLTGELLRLAEQYVAEGLHPRILTDGLDRARDACADFLKSDFQVALGEDVIQNSDVLISTARTSLQTKLDVALVEKIARAVVDAIQTIYTKDAPLDLNRVEIIFMERQSAMDSRFVRGLVLDHGGRHPDMPKVLKNVHIMTCNISLEYEQTETQAGFVYSTAEEREKLVESERKWLDERCRKIVTFKRSVCGPDETFCIINQKGVDPLSLDIFAKEGILCLRRAKRRNMERLTLACGGSPILSLDDLDKKQLGYAGKVSEVSYGEDKYTFVEDCPNNAQSCTLLLQGPNELTTAQVKDAVKDGLRAVKNTVEDKAVVPGGGAFEIAAHMYLHEKVVPETAGKTKLGVQVFADALLIIPKTLSANAGFDVQESILKLKDERKATGMAIGLNCRTGEPMLPDTEGVWDNVRVKRQSIYLSTVLANQLLLVDEVMRAGKQMGKPKPEDM
ncbi:T-complex protein 1 subunit zeta [Fistulifera solaris]|uniref:T-complex protein 1 subunit zeta n=1 Tax=Fistulifera solaris TaxID=1519565 RepID=A0A1Z5JVD3_FISSO|nr:T-complex protein 1 subunit zeta [Fistulifera solaris]|eukprot:GAX17792.1 T-complex protein 1 subunit zeta [Fistulifera solaris]